MMEKLEVNKKFCTEMNSYEMELVNGGYAPRGSEDPLNPPTTPHIPSLDDLILW